MKIVLFSLLAGYFFFIEAATVNAQTWFRVGEHACKARSSSDKPFFEALKQGDARSIERFLQKGADPNIKDDCSIAAANYALHRFRPDILKILVKAGADVNIVDGFHHRPLLFWALDAADDGETNPKLYEALRLLIDHGADVNLRGGLKRSALIESVLADNPEVASLLIDAGADINFRDDHDRTAYSYAAENGNIKLKKILIEAGADTKIGLDEYYKNYRENAFFQAAADGRTDVVEAMLAEGMDVDAVNEGKMTALMRATNESTVESLIKAGADVNLRDRAGFTALIWAAAFGREDIVLKLIAAGAEVDAETNEGRTALGLATRDQIKQVLINAGTKDR